MADARLYVVQNHLGLVKIGSSANTKVRFGRIARDDLCEVFPVAVLDGEGWREPFVHRALTKHNLVGEWYDGTDKARRAIIKAVQLRREIAWPMILADEDAVEAWLECVEARRARISDEKLYQRLIKNMEKTDSISGAAYGFHYNFKILEAIERYEGEQWDNFGRFHHTSHDTMPSFVSDIAIAMSLWPEDARPVTWTGSAWRCCIAALKLRRTRWMSEVRAA